MSINEVIFVGNVMGKPTSYSTGKSNRICKFKINIEECKKSTIHDVYCSGSLADKCHNSLKDGDYVIVVGKIVYNNRVAEIMANDIKIKERFSYK